MSSAKKIIDLIREEAKDAPKLNSTYLKLNEAFPLQPVVSKDHHKVALKILERLVDYSNEHKNVDEGVLIYMRMLAELLEEYELKHFPSGKVTGAEMLAYLMELQGLKQTDLSKELGGQSVVSEILKGKREMNLKQIRALAKRFNISPNAFI